MWGTKICRKPSWNFCYDLRLWDMLCLQKLCRCSKATLKHEMHFSELWVFQLGWWKCVKQCVYLFEKVEYFLGFFCCCDNLFKRYQFTSKKLLLYRLTSVCLPPGFTVEFNCFYLRDSENCWYLSKPMCILWMNLKVSVRHAKFRDNVRKMPPEWPWETSYP